VEELLKEVGVGGALAVLVLAQVFNFLKAKKNGANMCPLRAEVQIWENHLAKAISESLSPLIDNQTKTLVPLIEAHTRVLDAMTQTLNHRYEIFERILANQADLKVAVAQLPTLIRDK
jgi:hypothetical protein